MGVIDTKYDTFWKDIVEKNGLIDIEQVKKELYDYSMMMDEVSKAYDMVTGGRISKPNTAAHHVNFYANENWQAAYDEGYADAKEEFCIDDTPRS